MQQPQFEQWAENGLVNINEILLSDFSVTKNATVWANLQKLRVSAADEYNGMLSAKNRLALLQKIQEIERVLIPTAVDIAARKAFEVIKQQAGYTMYLRVFASMLLNPIVNQVFQSLKKDEDKRAAVERMKLLVAKQITMRTAVTAGENDFNLPKGRFSAIEAHIVSFINTAMAAQQL